MQRDEMRYEIEEYSYSSGDMMLWMQKWDGPEISSRSHMYDSTVRDTPCADADDSPALLKVN